MANEDDDLSGKPLIEAVRDEDHSRIEKLLSTDDTSIRRYINHQDEDGSTALHLSIGNQKLVTRLLKHYADPNVKNHAGETPLHIAARMDLMETVILLILHGAMVHEANQSEDVVTPAMVAAKAKSKGSLQILMFCGAKFPKSEPKKRNSMEDPENEICDAEEQENCDRILQGFRDRKENENSLGMEVNLIGTSRETMFLFRRMDTSYQDSNPTNIPVIESESGENLISSIYQFRVSNECICDLTIDITVEITPKINRYEDIALIQVVQDKNDLKLQYRKITYSKSKEGKQAKFGGITLYPNPSGGFTAMGVYRKNKKQAITVEKSTENQTFKSDVDKRFTASFSSASLSGVTEVEIEVNPVDATMMLNKDTKTSNFCSIEPKMSNEKVEASMASSETSTSSSAENKIDLSMPRVDDLNDSSIHVVVCPSGASPENGGSWKAAKGEITENHQDETVSIAGRVVGFGRYIVLALKKTAKFGYNMMLMVRELYVRASGITANCVLFTAVKLRDRYNYLVQVIFCERDQMDTEIRDLEKEKFVLKKISSINISVETKRTYYIHLDVKDGDPFPKEDLPIKYQHSMSKYYIFTVTRDQFKTPAGYIKVFKRPPKKDGKLIKYFPYIYFS